MKIGSPLVLVIDEHEDSRIIIRMIGQHAGFDVVDAASVRGAFELARRRRPSVVIVDLDRSHLGPTDLLTWLRTEPCLQGVAMLALSSNDEDRAALAAGFGGFVRKPLRVDALTTELRRLATPLDA